MNSSAGRPVPNAPNCSPPPARRRGTSLGYCGEPKEVKENVAEGLQRTGVVVVEVVVLASLLVVISEVTLVVISEVVLVVVSEVVLDVVSVSVLVLDADICSIDVLVEVVVG